MSLLILFLFHEAFTQLLQDRMIAWGMGEIIYRLKAHILELDRLRFKMLLWYCVTMGKLQILACFNFHISKTAIT